MQAASARVAVGHAPTPNDSTVMQTAIARIAVGHAPTPSDRAALEPCDDVDLHWAQVKAALAVKAADHKSMGDDVKPLSQLSCDECDMWRYLQLAKRIAAIEPSSGGAPVVGICAPTGAGKSTLVQLLRMLLERVLCIGQTVEVSLDDFLSSQKERQQHGIKTRWDVNSTNEDFAPKLAELKHSTEASVIELPMFEKARDDRRTGSRRIEGKVACVLFEGWRVGVDHPNFAPFNAHLDLLVYVEADLEAIFVQKQEAAARGVASTGGHDMYAQYGGFKGVVERFYRPIAQEHILPVAGWSDVVLRKAGVDADGVPQHTLEGIDWHAGRWQAHKSASRLETPPCVVVGGGQAGALEMPAAPSLFSLAFFSSAFLIPSSHSVSLALSQACAPRTSYKRRAWPTPCSRSMKWARPGSASGGTPLSSSRRTGCARCPTSRAPPSASRSMASWSRARSSSTFRPLLRSTTCQSVVDAACVASRAAGAAG